MSAAVLSGMLQATFVTGARIVGEFVRGDFGIEENSREPNVRRDDAIAFLDGGSVQEKRGHPFARAGFPQVDERAGETIVGHRVAPPLLPAELERAAAIEMRD